LKAECRPLIDRLSVRANLIAVLTKLKFWLVLLLALILPIKGAMATVGMLCHVPASQLVQAAPASHAHASHDAGRVLAEVGHHQHQHATSDSSDADVSPASCLACAAVCGASPVPASGSLNLPTFEPSRDWRRLTLLAPPSREMAGLERPPRSI
jgi:hypothetical protein